MRRLHFPYYDEARRHWEETEEDGLFDAINEIGFYDPEMLERIVREYGPREQAVSVTL